MPPIRASELGEYLYCRRAWWYRRRGVPAQNQRELSAGTRLHYAHNRSVLRSAALRAGAFLLLLAALVLLAVYWTAQWF